MRKIFEKILDRRTSLGLSQKDLSEMSEVSLRTINAIENGTANPSIDILCKVIDQLGLKLTLVERVTND